MTARPPAVRAGVEDNGHLEVEHPGAWAHRYLDELDPCLRTVREMSTGAGGAANERGAPALGRPSWWVWLPVRDLDMRLEIVNDPFVVAEVGRDVDRGGHGGRRVDGRGGLGGGGEAEDGGCEPASDDGGKSELGHRGVFFFLSSIVFEPWREVAVRTLCRPGDDALLCADLIYRTRRSEY